MKKLIIIGIILLVIAAIGWQAGLFSNGNNVVNYRLGKVEKGDIVQTVSATGVIQPITLVQVGTQVTGPIKKLYADFNSRVKEGDLLAQIDPSVFSARVDQDVANLVRAEAEVERVKANLVQAENELARSQELTKRDLISKSELDTAVASRDSLVAQVKIALASLEQSKSALQVSRINLDYTTIKSPIDGVVISRNVDAGQTVAASLSAPTLFIIANDLKKVRVQASVSEADIGKIKTGQKIKFMVDAYADLEFNGIVDQIYLSSTTVQNVVTYTVIINADNPDEKLMPGMTANLTVDVASRVNVIKIPNAALRFEPEPGQITNGRDTEQPDQKRQKGLKKRQMVWVEAGGGVKGIPVKTGITDNSFTELVSDGGSDANTGKGELKEGDEVITGVLQKGQEDNMVNPFAPGRPGGMRRR
ncbi:MAG: efflux RND transporter periplasmic adaptor subunit [Planctomycetes bacterium]|nr:efflux RND transporter periplasmic adaptor subunit [Planctomycetota bacterium]